MEDAGPDDDQLSGDAGQAADTPSRASAREVALSSSDTSGWIINWSGVIPVLLVLAVVVVAWRWTDGGGGSDAAVDAEPSAVTTTVSPDRVTTTSASTTTTRPAPTTDVPATTVPDAPRVVIRGEMGPCNFGANCLIAGFEIEGFDEQPSSFLCIYPNSRRERSFNRRQVDVACVTADEGDTITIEVAGVRSATISEENLDGTG